MKKFFLIVVFFTFNIFSAEIDQKNKSEFINKITVGEFSCLSNYNWCSRSNDIDQIWIYVKMTSEFHYGKCYIPLKFIMNEDGSFKKNGDIVKSVKYQTNFTLEIDMKESLNFLLERFKEKNNSSRCVIL